MATDSPHSSTASLKSHFDHLLIHLPDQTQSDQISSPPPSLHSCEMDISGPPSLSGWLSPPGGLTGGSPDPMWSPPVPGPETADGNDSASPRTALNGEVSGSGQTPEHSGGGGGGGDGDGGDSGPGDPPTPRGPGRGQNRGRRRQRRRRWYRPHSVDKTVSHLAQLTYMHDLDFADSACMTCGIACIHAKFTACTLYYCTHLCMLITRILSFLSFTVAGKNPHQR